MKIKTSTRQEGTSKAAFQSLLAALAVFFIVSCATRPDVVGRWREIGRSATLEFWRDGTFRAVDNQGMEVLGKFTVDNKGNIRFEIPSERAFPDLVNGRLTLRGNELTFEFTDHKGVERYRRVKR